MNGNCLCGAVAFTSPDTRELSVCHCGFCRKWGGGPLFVVHCGPNVVFTGGGQVAVYPSSNWAERAFCKRCGTHLYYKLLATGEYFVPAGTFGSTDFELSSQIYVDKRPGYYELANRTPMLTEAQVIEQYGQPGDKP
ncbi:Glutathione-dependent formaldehyde-activating enzyme [Pigmentiphaga humi]|uniref:Glutathione-dependent formaldehyde-activating enzyme n=2 Tax=Pigmentiphaga humi TaxID=2478468 RepID=A0A3P4AZX4_9BURK|nr:Glutathione-dependent formaldehyde-activating enzyme [Pigmentiphaga humi]